CVSIRVSALLLLHMLSVIFFIFFFSSRRRHTRSKRDWSSDVCSSDLPLYSTIMATVCGIIRMVLMGIPPLALTGAVFGALLAGVGARLSKNIYGSIIGEIIGTGVIGSLLSYPVMVWFTGTKTNLFWFVYTPRFIGAT